jgi:hypothetical protein
MVRLPFAARLILGASVVAISVGLITPSAFAQGAGPHERDACTRDVSRFCRGQMNDGDSVVLACLKQNRAKLSKGCAKVLTDHGQ